MEEELSEYMYFCSSVDGCSGWCWRKPTKYFKDVKVLVSSPYSLSSGGPQQPENRSRKYKNNILNKDVFQYHLQNVSAKGPPLALSAAC